MWQSYINATSLEQVVNLLSEYGEKARIIAGGTDLMLEIERRVRTGIDVLIDVTRIPGLDAITLDENGILHLGPLVTHNQCVASKLIRERAFPLAAAAWEVGAPQIRNRGTIAGNLITASPANDTITPLMALGASVTLRSIRGERSVPLEEFYMGVRRTVIAVDEMLVDIFFPALTANQRGTFLKLGLRRAQAISLVDVAAVLALDGGVVTDAAITLGAVAPTIVHAVDAENSLIGRLLDPAAIDQASRLAMRTATPIDDVRGSAIYRKEMVRVLTSRALKALLAHNERDHFPHEPALLWGSQPPEVRARANGSQPHQAGSEIRTVINGQERVFSSGHDKSLLHLLRDEAGLMGTKEGCAEGECGACTVFLDGIAVMSCLVPAPRADGAEIVTIEGLANPERLHPVQQTFIDAGAVQCGYCTPGFLMSATKLLEEYPRPSRDQIRQAITGNLCRCTGYYKIIEAIELASQEAADG